MIWEDLYLNKQYYIDCYLKYHNKQQSVNHSNPEDYGLSRDDALKMKLRYLKSKKKELDDEITNLNVDYLSGKRPLAYVTLNILEEKRDKLNKDIFINSKILNKKENITLYDVSNLKNIPLNKITEILSNGFFMNNPFRNERSPSNSLAWDKKTNRWTDFGSGEYGDSIDLVMAMNKCDFREACKILTLII